MGFWSNFLEALRNLLSTRQRSALALIGIVIGTGSVVAMISIGGMVQHESLKRFRDMGTDLINISIFGGDRETGLTLDDLPSVAAGLAPWLTAIAPAIENNQWLKLGQGEPESISLVGTTEPLRALYRLSVARGRFISELDRYQRFCVLGRDLADLHAAAGRPLAPGDLLELQGRIFRVIGILDTAPVDPFGNNFNRAAIMDLGTLTRFGTETIGKIGARVRPGLAHREVMARIQDWFGRHHPKLNIDIRSPEQIIAQMQAQSRLLTLMLGAIGSISLIVGGVGVMNIMLVSIAERRREIGVRLAIGARRRDVRAQFLVEAVILSLIGGLLGLALGTAAAWGVAQVSGWEFFVSPGVMLLGFGVSAAVGVFFGFYPAVQASRIDPILALRS